VKDAALAESVDDHDRLMVAGAAGLLGAERRGQHLQILDGLRLAAKSVVQFVRRVHPCLGQTGHDRVLRFTDLHDPLVLAAMSVMIDSFTGRNLNHRLRTLINLEPDSILLATRPDSDHGPIRAPCRELPHRIVNHHQATAAVHISLKWLLSRCGPVPAMRIQHNYVVFPKIGSKSLCLLS